MAYLLFFSYLIVLSWLATKINYFKAAGLPAKWLSGLFLLKVAGGVVYGYVHGEYITNSDTWSIYNWSIKHYELLLKDPIGFIQEWNSKGIGAPKANESFSNIFGTDDSSWNSLRSLIIIKLEALINIFSFGHYYVNVILYTFLTFGGYIAFYRGLLLFYPNSRITSLIAVFLIPSCFFWTSGMYKDGILFMLFGYIVHNMALLIRQPERYLLPFFKIACCFAAVFILRSYVVLLLIPCLTAWWLAVKYPLHIMKWFIGIFFCGLMFCFLAPYLYAGADLPLFLANRRNEFTALTANSALPASKLSPNLWGYIIILPEAINYGFLRPYIWENKGLFYVPFALELVTLYILLIVYIVKKRTTIPPMQYAFFLFGLFLVGSSWLLIGYTTPIVGALIRYKSIFLPFVIAHLLYYVYPHLNKLNK